ncbi:hypothetical protein HN873_042714 [Arachis hypogaea]
MLHNTLLYLTLFLQGLHARARAQEEEIFSLWEQVAVACMKMLNEKCNLERQFSELRNAKDGETRADLLSEASVEYETKESSSLRNIPVVICYK